jgi:predicted HTH transcriptional regulator
MNVHNESEKRILEFIKKERVITSSELAKYLKISWNTAERYLLELVIEGHIDRIKKEGVNLWVEKK